MYFNSTNSFLHGIMFHHFHDNINHKKSQGSIDRIKLKKIINYIGKDNIINPPEFIKNVKSGNLKKKKVCLTFDDGLLCQFDVAKKLLDDYGIKGFFFVYSSIFDTKPDLLEVYRYFRVNFFPNMNSFYSNFFSNISFDLSFYFQMHRKIIKETKKKFPFYSYNDIKFRLVRDHYLSKDQYDSIMHKMMSDYEFNYQKVFKKIFLGKGEIINLIKDGHHVGLHSHSHPTKIENFSFLEQKREYDLNKAKLEAIINRKKIVYNINSMSHPCGSYNLDTAKILNNLNIELGFKQIMIIEKEKGMNKINNSNLEVARIDHSLLLMKMRQ